MKSPRKPCFVGTGMLDVFKGFRNLSASSFEGFASKASGEQAVSLLCLAHSIMAKPSFAKLSCFWLVLYYLRLATITTDQAKLLRVVSRLRYVRERIKHILSCRQAQVKLNNSGCRANKLHTPPIMNSLVGILQPHGCFQRKPHTQEETHVMTKYLQHRQAMCCKEWPDTSLPETSHNFLRFTLTIVMLCMHQIILEHTRTCWLRAKLFSQSMTA